MRYTLSIIAPPMEGAGFGRAMTHPNLRHPVDIAGAVRAYINVLWPETGISRQDRFPRTVADAENGTYHTHEASGMTFRVDPDDRPPHPCPCCTRLVVPTDHAYADADDAYCLGCWGDTITPGCLPQNSAHTTANSEPAEKE